MHGHCIRQIYIPSQKWKYLLKVITFFGFHVTLSAETKRNTYNNELPRLSWIINMINIFLSRLKPNCCATPLQSAKEKKVNKYDEIDEAILRSLKDIQEMHNSGNKQKLKTFLENNCSCSTLGYPRQKVIAKLHI